MTDPVESLVVVAGFYYPLRLLSENWVKLSLPHWWANVAGILSWATVLSMAGPLIAVAYACANVVHCLTMGARFVRYSIHGVPPFSSAFSLAGVQHLALRRSRRRVSRI